MSNQSIDAFIAMHSNSLPQSEMVVLRKRLNLIPSEKQQAVSATTVKSPVLTLVFAIFLGWTGIDKFYIGDVGLGIAKLFFFNLSIFLLVPAAITAFTSHTALMVGAIVIQITMILVFVLLFVWYWFDVFTSYRATRYANLYRLYKNVLLITV